MLLCANMFREICEVGDSRAVLGKKVRSVGFESSYIMYSDIQRNNQM